MLCVLSSALPANAVLSPYSLMPCCRGMMMGAGGECHGNSCPLHLRASAKPPEPTQDDPACETGHGLHAKAKAAPAPQATSQHAHGHDHAQAEVEHDHGEGVSPQNTPQPTSQSSSSQSTSRQPSVVVASLGRPCPSDCCGAAAGSFNGLRRPRHEAALTGSHKPRPPTAQSQTYIFSGLIKSASEMRRSHPPRAPPAILNSRTF
jgi:hypothetical protein